MSGHAPVGLLPVLALLVIYASFIAVDRNRSPLAWFLAGLMCSPVAIVVLLTMPPRPHKELLP